MKNSSASDINQEQFDAIRPLLKSARKKINPLLVHLHQVFYALLDLPSSGCQWRVRPEEFAKWHTVH